MKMLFASKYTDRVYYYQTVLGEMYRDA
jgi:hypothetical protein